MPGLESVTVTVWVKTGSRFEDKRINGISHFLEHMVFKGSVKRPSAKAISEAVDSIGGEFNAGTSKDWTNFYIKSRSGSAEIAMDVLSDMVLSPLLKSEEIEREKGTIIQELAMYEDTPMIKIHDVFEGLIFKENSLGWDIGGEAKSVKRITKSDFELYRALHYYPENMFVSVSGGIEEKKALELVEKYFNQLKAKSEDRKTTFKDTVFKGVQTKPQFQLKTKKVEQAHVILGFLSEGRGYAGRFAQSVLSTILSGPMSSRLFIEVRERRGLAYAVKPANDKFNEVGYTGVYAGVNVAKSEEAIKVILDQLYGLADGKFPISPKELEKTKEYLKGHIALSLEDTQVAGDFFAEQIMFLDEILTPDALYKRIDNVTVEEVVQEAKKIFIKDHLNLAIIGPYKDVEKYKKLLI
ncbi:MAG: Peptidase M16 domain protein [Candidatus Woesebacteria bacterium GW2011_GWB1_39_10]|uniref:Peptidase M16 domain protein n=3 Tax=Candidatus Woeseibacteriota TaxID=1752722 RepID=A0A0G0X6Y0_9BACT|nr:MAG: Peptidase M16 domain protein [Candidatus Woesebacteria bacterium GW2011_GWB1_39_10]KKR92420.1 MAG: Peptidase M16 domain protein [Candidatus Woesebacteria bacterium GW2011_GWA1_41_13b]